MLKDPLAFLTSIQAVTKRALAIRVYNSILGTIDKPHNPDNSSSIFEQAFIEHSDIPPTKDRIMQRFAVSVDISAPAQVLLVLPPLFLRCEDDFVVRIHHTRQIYLIGDVPSGGIFPVFPRDSMQLHSSNSDMLAILDYMYDKASADFINHANLATWLSPPQSWQRATDSPGQKDTTVVIHHDGKKTAV